MSPSTDFERVQRDGEEYLRFDINGTSYDVRYLGGGSVTVPESTINQMTEQEKELLHDELNGFNYRFPNSAS